MSETTSTIEQHIAAPPAQVWATSCDTRRHAEWVVNTLEPSIGRDMRRSVQALREICEREAAA